MAVLLKLHGDDLASSNSDIPYAIYGIWYI